MGGANAQRNWAAAWGSIAVQHGVIARWQLLELGFTTRAIEHRIAHTRLFCVFPGVYAFGRREIGDEGWWMAAVLSCGPKAALSHQSAAALWAIRPVGGGESALRRSAAGATRRVPIDVSVPSPLAPRTAGIVVHRRIALEPEVGHHRGIPVTSPALTLVDLSSFLPAPELERAVVEADKRDLIDPETLRRVLLLMPRRPGRNRLLGLLDRRTFVFTDSRLEQSFLAIARHAGLPPPLTQHWLLGFRVDFYWPGLGLVVETDGLRYHRTPAQQAQDRRRDQALTASGLTVLRFTHGQIRFEPAEVERTLRAVLARLAAAARLSPR
jgi:very-short-patch-repair endonuclease